MPKAHKIILEIKNDTGSEMKYKTSYFYSGRLGDGEKFCTIKARDHEKFTMYERDNALAGCSGYVVFSHVGMDQISIGFSNPVWGASKIGVEVGLKADESGYNSMEDHYNQTARVECAGGHIDFYNTGGNVNSAVVEVYDY